jgi:zinc transport system ATP-binding protein
MNDLKLAKGATIEFCDVSLAYGNTQVLENLSFAVAPGTVHCLIGPNGGGKTSTLKSLLGETPHTGKIAIHWSAGKVIGYVPQALDFDHNLPISVIDLLTILCHRRPAFLGSGKATTPKLLDLLERVGMRDKANRLVGELSGGERQRVILAQALAPSPNLLILDEPTSGLDKRGTEIFTRIVSDLRADGVTILCVHHNLREVHEMADNVTCINRRAVFTGTPGERLTKRCLFDIFSQ